jgi:UDPglucose--hexose-1-phosphate uridylyltransferase
MSELRQDPTTHNWVIIAPERARRPHGDTDVWEQGRCPFCPGNEVMTPPELWRLPDPAGGWRVRVIPNKFPMLVPTAGSEPRSPHVAGALDGYGHHEVIIESPRHDWDIATSEVGAVRDILHAYRARHRALRDAPGVAVVVAFRNHGAGSGTSLVHPHSQVVGLPVVPPLVRQRWEVSRQHFADVGRCLTVDLVERELAAGRRLVYQAGPLVAFQPFAATAPFETWVTLRFQQASFGDADDGILTELATLLRAVLGGLRRVLDDPPYHLVVHSAPPVAEERLHLNWQLQIVPHTTTPGGFELGSGVPVNPTRPEDTAATLRAAIAACSA